MVASPSRSPCRTSSEGKRAPTSPVPEQPEQPEQPDQPERPTGHRVNRRLRLTSEESDGVFRHEAMLTIGLFRGRAPADPTNTASP